MNFFKKGFLLLSVLFFTISAHAQFTATWAFTSNNTGVKAGANQANITIANAIPGAAFAGNIGYSSSGIKCQPQSGNDWPIIPTDGWHLDFPISPNGAVDATLLGLTFAAKTSGGNSTDNIVSLAVQKDGVGPFTFFGTPQTAVSGGSSTVTFPAFSKKLYTGHTYIVRMYMYAASTGISASRSLSVKTNVFNGTIAAAGTQPSVTTASASTTSKYTATVTGAVTAGTYNIVQSGVVWDVNTNPTISLTSKTNNGPTTSAAINLANGGGITGLTAGTTYNVRSYVESETGDVFYGANLSFTTNAATIPSLTTNNATNITSVKATSGGVIIDSGGVSITAKGVCWGTATNPTIANSKTNDGAGNSNYSSLLKVLAPNTTYYARAYATNSIGTAYGNEISFTTLAPEPNITTTTLNGQNSIPFGDVIVGNSSAIKSYTLTATNLTPATGTINITATADFEISTSPTSNFSAALSLNYTSSSIPTTTIYVRFKPTKFGSYNNTITHSGGGANASNIDDVTVTGKGIQNPSDFSNVGHDFWVGYGFQSLMTGSNNQEMILYISSKQDDSVIVEIGNPTDANYYRQAVWVPANVATTTLTIPKNGVQDARLNATGISNKGIHVYSNNQSPFALWAHIYASQSSGATMVIPTNTWGSNYSVLTVGGKTNSGVPHSFFFVQAAEDNTIIDIMPTADITANAGGTNVLYPAGTPFNITLNKGQVFNALGKLITSSTGNDLTGTTVISRDCNKKISLFTGNGRVLLGTSLCTPNEGSDNFIQQMLPKQAWGTKYLTSPFRDMESGFYKVIVSDPSTNVTVNGLTLPNTQLVQNAYTIETDTLLKIEADQPIMVAQFLMSHSCGQGVNTPSSAYKKNGDPEMVILSPVQQAIKEVTFYSTNNYSVTRNLLNVVIPNTGVSSFELDGVNMASSFATHFADPTYSYAVFDNLTGNTSHTIKSNIAFTAMAYGWKNTDHESYGYNAGTSLKALNQFISVQNPYPNVSGDSVVPACLNNSFVYSVNLPYKPTSMKWDFFNNPIQLPNSDSVVISNPTPKDSFTINGALMYKYEIPTVYTFSGTGSFPVNITMNATNADGCAGIQTVTFTLKVLEPPTPYPIYDTSGICGSTIVSFTDSSYDKNGYGMNGREWTFTGLFPGSSTDSIPTIPVPGGTYTFKLRAINSIGCFKDTTFGIKAYDAPVIDSITFSKPAACTNQAIIITANTTLIGGVVSYYYWDFGDGTKDTTTTNSVSHIYKNVNTNGFFVSVYASSSKACTGFSTNTKISVYDLKAGFSVVSPQCVNTSIIFTDTSKGTNVSSPLSASWLWQFKDAANTTSATPSPIFTYTQAGTYNVYQRVSLSKNGVEFCADSISKSLTITPVLNITNVTSTSGNHTCVGKNVTFTANGTTASGNIKWYWSSTDGRKDTTTTNTLTRPFSSAGTVTISVFAKIDGGCASNTNQTFINVFNPKADLSFTSPQCVNKLVVFADASTGLTPTALVDVKWLWSFRDAANSTAITQNSNFTYNAAGNYSVKLRVSLAIGGIEFCTDSMSKPLVVNPILTKPIITVDASKTTTSSLTFNWNAIASATGYSVAVDGGSYITPSSGSTGTQHVLNNLLPNTTHIVCVKPLGPCDGDSACASGKTIEPNQDVYIPNTFTPNGDGKNDKMVVCSNTIKSVKMMVFSQTGERLYEGTSTSGVNNCFELWDGVAWGKIQPVGVYAYLVTVTMLDGKIVNKKGLFNLIR